MAEDMADLTPAERRQRRIEEAKRRAAEKLGKDVSELKSSPAQEQTGETKSEAQAVAVKGEPGNGASAKSATRPPASTAATRQAQRVAAAKAAAEARTGPATPDSLRPTPPPVAKPAPADEEEGQPGMNRREFMTYAWAAALGLLTAETGAATYFFMYPRFRAGEFGGKFEMGSASSLPSMDKAPEGNTTGKFWWVNTEDGPKALYMVCTHLGCLFKWAPQNGRFECPCHGSKFTREGFYIEGPAPRSLDQFVVEVVENGSVVASTEDTGDAIQPPSVPSESAQIVVDTGSRIKGKPNSQSPARASA